MRLTVELFYIKKDFSSLCKARPQTLPLSWKQSFAQKKGRGLSRKLILFRVDSTTNVVWWQRTCSSSATGYSFWIQQYHFDTTFNHWYIHLFWVLTSIFEFAWLGVHYLYVVTPPQLCSLTTISRVQAPYCATNEMFYFCQGITGRT